ncbi:MAG: hypothetical protein L7F77_09435 [Candidatus Magnetominusculus sp. LBB02]|nr:hypothetical protein [Candidatus Magnetominusculus sp. LBB02]
MEDTGKLVYYERLRGLIAEIEEESHRIPVDRKKLGDMLNALYAEIQLMPEDEVKARELLLEVYFSGQYVLGGLQTNIEDSDKYISTDTLALLISEISNEVQHSPVAIERLAELNAELNLEILRLQLYPGSRLLEIATELYNSTLRLLAVLSVKHVEVDADNDKVRQCWAKCVKSRTFNQPSALTAHDLLNPPANRLVGPVKALFGGPGHPTSWQHHLWFYKYSKRFPRLGPIVHPMAKWGGRLAILPTLAEGSYDISSMMDCKMTCELSGKTISDCDGFTLTGEPCDSLTDDSCITLPDIYGK